MTAIILRDTRATFPIDLPGELIYPADLALLYGATDDLMTAARRCRAVPRDIEATWPNVLGFLRRIPDQIYHRPPPNGADDTPTEREVVAFRDALLIHARRLRAAIATAARSTP